jgi:hypothetical protein
MEPLNETAQVDRELKQARDDLRETLEEVNHKVEVVEARLRPQAILRRNPVALAFLAAAIGFLAGSDRQPRPLRWLVIGGLLGAALAGASPGSDDDRDATSK